MSSKIVLAPDVIAVLDAAEIDGASLRLVGQLDRALYLKTNQALEALGGVWFKKYKAHLFPEDTNVTDLIENAILTGMVVDTDKELDFYPTPLAVANQIIHLAGIEPHMRVLEPSAGGGALVAALLFHQSFIVDVCEIDPKRAERLKTDRLLHFVADDFLKYQPVEGYDRIIANPPFSRRRDLTHVAHMWELLKPGGRLVSVMAAGIKYRDDNKAKAFRALIPKYELIDLPENSFKVSGTGVNTVLLVADKSIFVPLRKAQEA